MTERQNDRQDKSNIPFDLEGKEKSLARIENFLAFDA
jgi:hypothetical protein